MPTHFSIEKLRSDYAVDGFDCDNEELNRFLARYALSSQLASSSQTYVGLADISIVGFYTLTVGQVDFDNSRNV